MKFECVVVYENCSDKSDIGNCRIKVNQGQGQSNKTFPHLPQYKLSGPIIQLWYKLGSLY